MFKRKNTVLGLDIGKSSIKALEMTAVGNDYHITKYGQIETPQVDDQEINDDSHLIEPLTELIQSLNLKSKRVATSVSGREVIVRYITMQAASEESLASEVRFEADKYIPFDLEEVVLDSQKLEETSMEMGDTAEMKVLLVAAKKILIDKRVQLLKKVGLQPYIIDVDSFALGNAFELRGILSPRPDVGGKVVALVDIGYTKTNMNIMIGNTSFFTREIYLAGNEFTEEIQKKMEVTADIAEALKQSPGVYALEVQEAIASIMDDLASEINLSFEYFESQFDQEVEEIYLSGGGSQLFSLEPDFERLFAKRIHRWDPTEHFIIDEYEVDVDILKANAPQLAISVGLASRIRNL